MASTPGLVVQITASIAGLLDGYKKASAATAAFAASVDKTLEGTHKTFEKLGGTIKSIAVPLVAAGTAFATFEGVARSLEKADTLGRISAGLGVTVENLQRLQQAASLSGSSAEEMSKGLEKVSRFVAEAGDSASGAAKTLRDLNVPLDDLRGKSVDEAFLRLSDALAKTEDQGQRTAGAFAILGKDSGKLAALVAGGSDEIQRLGDEAERSGRIMSNMDFGSLNAAKASVEEMQAAFSALADRMAVVLAPAIDWVAEGINSWIGNAKEFDSFFKKVMDGVIVAAGLAVMSWQGLKLIWEAAKVAVGAYGQVVYTVLDKVTGGILWLKETAVRVWKLMAASFNVSWTAIGTFFVTVKGKILNGFAEIQERVGKTMVGIGQAAKNSGISQIEKLGDQAISAGLKLEDGAVRIRSAVSSELDAAASNLERAKGALWDAQDGLSKPIDTGNIFGQLAENASNFRKGAIESLRAVADEIKAQEGGNAISDMFKKWEQQQAKHNDKAKKLAEDGAKERTLALADGFDKQAKYLAEYGTRYENHVFNLWKRNQDAQEKIVNAARNAKDENKALMAEQNADYAMFLATKAARDDAYTKGLLKSQASAAEEIANVQKNQALSVQTARMQIAADEAKFMAGGAERGLKRESDFRKDKKKSDEEYAAAQYTSEDERQAAIAAMRADYANRDKSEGLKTLAMWESGAKGKMEVMAGFLSSMATLMQSKNRQMFEVGKIAAIGECIISTILGAQQAFTSLSKIPIVGPGLGIAAAATATIAGMARVQQIQATQFGGGGSASAGSAGGAAPSLSSAAAAGGGAGGGGQSSTVNVALYGDTFSAGQVRGLIGQINEASANGVTLKAQVA